MKNMKKLLSVMAAFGFTTVAAVNVVACSNKQTTIAQINTEVANTLGLYDNGKSKVGTTISFNSQNNNVLEFKTNTALAGTINFNNLLNSDKKAKDEQSAAFLKELGFTSGDTTKAYSTDEQTKIGELKIFDSKSNINSSDIKANAANTDFQAPAGTGQIIIGTDISKPLKTYNINTIANDLTVPTIAQGILTNPTTILDLAASKFLQANKVSDFVGLVFKTSENAGLAASQKWTNLISFLNQGKMTFTFKDGSTDVPTDQNFPNKPITLSIAIGGVNIVKDIDMGTPAAK